MKAQVRAKVTTRPLVSVVCISYNQEDYIEQALRGFVMQKHSDFDIEIIIADDASTDNTAKIIERYQKDHANIRAILREKNVGIQNNLNKAMRSAKGHYIALCEGDDFWTDENKLQKQVDFLEEHKDYALCFHPVRVLHEEGDKKDYLFPGDSTGFTLKRLIEGNFIQTNSVMYRRQKYDEIPDYILPLDWYYHLYHARFGKIGFINETMAAYRRHSTGVWQRNKKNEYEFWLKRAVPHLRMHEQVIKLFDGRPTLQSYAWKSSFTTAREVFSVLAEHADYATSREIMKQFPELTTRLIANSNDSYKEQGRRLDIANNKLYQQGVDAQVMQETIGDLRAENARIYHNLERTLEYKLKRGLDFAVRRSLKKKSSR